MLSTIIYCITIILFISLNVHGQGLRWEWQNPKPQGSRAKNVNFSDPLHGYIPLVSGEYFYSADGGKSWSLKSVKPIAETSSFILDMFFLDSLNGFASSYGVKPVFAKTEDGGKSWLKMTSPPSDSNDRSLTSIYFLDKHKGFVAGDDWIYFTSDGGSTWIDQAHFLYDTPQFNKITFIDSLRGFAAGNSLYKTTDGGKAWLKDTSVSLTGDYGYEEILFFNSHLGWIGDGNNIKRTTDGGKAWTKYDLSTEGDTRINYFYTHQLMFRDAANGWLATSLGLYLTADSGKTWKKINKDFNFTGIYFIDSLNGTATGGILGPGVPGIWNKLLMTSDGGYTWTWTSSNVTESGLLSVDFVNNLEGWASGEDGTILNTTDGGRNWQKQKSNTTVGLKKIYFLNSSEGWASGSSGRILHTTNSGKDWLSISLDKPYYFQSVQFTDSDHGWVVGENYPSSGKLGIVLSTEDGGRTWSDKTPANAGRMTSVFFFNAKKGYAISGGASMSDFSAIYYTSDSGETWNRKAYDETANYVQICFADSLHGFLASSRKGIFKTTDGGITWSESYYKTGEFYYDVSFSDSLTGLACGMFGNIIYTSDGGVNWIKQDNISHSELSGCEIVNKDKAWAVGSFGTILSTVISDSSTSAIKCTSHKEPASFELYQNYPNPFNPSTNIKFRLNQTGLVKVEVYDIVGRKIRTLLNEEKESGEYTLQFSGEGLSSGIYIYQVIFQGKLYAGKMTILK